MQHLTKEANSIGKQKNLSSTFAGMFLFICFRIWWQSSSGCKVEVILWKCGILQTHRVLLLTMEVSYAHFLSKRWGISNGFPPSFAAVPQFYPRTPQVALWTSLLCSATDSGWKEMKKYTVMDECGDWEADALGHGSTGEHGDEDHIWTFENSH